MAHEDILGKQYYGKGLDFDAEIKLRRKNNLFYTQGNVCQRKLRGMLTDTQRLMGGPG